MKAIVFEAKDQLQYADIAESELQDGEVRIAVRASGICHTDFEILKGNYGSSAFPLIPGHEYAGEIVEVGPNVQGFDMGDCVVVDPNIGCGQCRACQNDRINLCENLGAYGVTQNGGFAEFCNVHVSALHNIEGISFANAALAEPMGCVLNGVNAIDAGNAQNALIFGAGPIGLLFGLAARANGAGEISYVDLDEERLALAESLGFAGIHAGSDALGGMSQSFDLVVDATGVPRVAGGMIDYVYNGGKMLCLGVCPKDARIEIAPFELFRRQLTLAGSHSLNHDIREAIDIIRKYPEELGKLVTHQVPIAEIEGIMRDGAPKGSMKIQAVWL